MRIKTTIWDLSQEEFKQKYLSLAWRYGFFFLIYFGLFIYQENYIMAGVTLLPILSSALIHISHNKWRSSINNTDHNRLVEKNKKKI